MRDQAVLIELSEEEKIAEQGDGIVGVWVWESPACIH